MKELTVSYSADTSVGSRKMNQDVYLAMDEISSLDTVSRQSVSGQCTVADKTLVFAVCDGIGSFADSARVAHAALSAVRDCEKNEDEDLSGCVYNLLLAAKKAARNCTRNGDAEGSTTVSLLAVSGNKYVFVNIGDSPAFEIENGNIREISQRHNMAALKRKMGLPSTPEEERILLNHLNDEGRPLSYYECEGEISSGSAFLICSDGITNAFDESEILDGINSGENASFFIDGAEKLENADNCTAIVIRFSEADAQNGEKTENQEINQLENYN